MGRAGEGGGGLVVRLALRDDESAAHCDRVRTALCDSVPAALRDSVSVHCVIVC